MFIEMRPKVMKEGDKLQIIIKYSSNRMAQWRFGHSEQAATLAPALLSHYDSRKSRLKQCGSKSVTIIVLTYWRLKTCDDDVVNDSSAYIRTYMPSTEPPGRHCIQGCDWHWDTPQPRDTTDTPRCLPTVDDDKIDHIFYSKNTKVPSTNPVIIDE